MADFDDEDLGEVDVYEEEQDNARDLTSGLVLTTSLAIILAIVTMLFALAKFHGVGPMAR